MLGWRRFNLRITREKRFPRTSGLDPDHVPCCLIIWIRTRFRTGQKKIGEFESLGSFIVKGKEVNRNKYSTSYPHPGYGWAARKEVIVAAGGFFEINIVGNGD